MRKLSKFITTLACLSTLTACPANGDGDGDGTDDTSETGTGDSTQSGTETSTGGDGDTTTSSGDGDGDTSSGDGDGDTSSGDGDGDTTTGDGDGDSSACQAGCEVSAMCEGDITLEECLLYCNEALEGLDAECTMLAETFFNCIGGLSCEEYQAYLDEPTPDYPCAEEEAALEPCDPGASSGSGDPDPTGGSEPPDPTGGGSDPNP